MKESFSHQFTFIYSAFFITFARVTVVTNRPDPKILQIAKWIPAVSLPPPATIAVITSGAPFPSARRVTPAKVWEHFKKSEIFAREGDK